MESKQCSKCKRIYLARAKYFYKRKQNGKYYLSSWCKSCMKQHIYSHRKRERKRPQLTVEQWSIRRSIRQRWRDIYRRCYDNRRNNYKYYGGRGIQNNFSNFEDFYNYIVNELQIDPRGLVLDRENNDGHYEKGNIRFVTWAVSTQNRRTPTEIREAEKRGSKL